MLLRRQSSCFHHQIILFLRYEIFFVAWGNGLLCYWSGYKSGITENGFFMGKILPPLLEEAKIAYGSMWSVSGFTHPVHVCDVQMQRKPLQHKVTQQLQHYRFCCVTRSAYKPSYYMCQITRHRSCIQASFS